MTYFSMRIKKENDISIITPNRPQEDEELVEYQMETINRPNASGTIRGPKALMTLAGKFIEYLYNTPASLINIPKVITKLNINNNRRIYDVINVLQGIGLMEKYSKNVVQWKGGEFAIRLRPEQIQHIDKLKSQIPILEREENQLDDQIRWLNQSIRNVCEEPKNCHLLYNTREEILQVYPNELNVVVKSPQNAQVDVICTDKLWEPNPRYEVEISQEFGHVEMSVLNRDACIEEKAYLG